MKKLVLSLAAVLCAVALWPLHALAAAYPDRPITFIIPYPPGGNADISLRVLAEAVEKRLGQKLVITPTPGAAGMVGLNKGMSSRPDGYTIFLAAQTSMTVTTQVRKVRFTWDKPIYICTVASPSLYLGVNKDAPKFNTFDEFLTYARNNPGATNIAQIGLRGTHQYVLLQIMKKFGVKIQPVPFDGGPQTVSAVLGGHADAVFTDNYNPALKAVFLTGLPSKNYPDTKTLTELGHGDIAAGIYYTVCAPPNTPKEIVEKLEAAFKDSINDKKYLEVLESLKWNPVWFGSAETREMVAKEAASVKRLIDEGLFESEK